MATWTRTLAEGADLLKTNVLIDKIDVYDVGPKQTAGIHVTRPLEVYDLGVPALVQTTSLANAAESQTVNLYSVKVASTKRLFAGQVVKVIRCERDPSLVGKHLLLDKVSQNGAAVIVKAVASDYTNVNQEGKP